MVDPLLALVPAKIPRIAVYLSEEVKADLEALASVERRSLSQMAAILIEESIVRAKQEGRLAEDKDAEERNRPTD